jgi:uncharacterized protein (UPF0303 family)
LAFSPHKKGQEARKIALQEQKLKRHHPDKKGGTRSGKKLKKRRENKNRQREVEVAIDISIFHPKEKIVEQQEQPNLHER